jgi:pimeloyl-ACP methyl ester carboxylesterase
VPRPVGRPRVGVTTFEECGVVEVTNTHVAVRPDLRLAIRVWGDDVTHEPTFVLVHGLASNARLWDGVARRLASAGHPVVAVDQRGHGRSDTPDEGYDFATVTEDLRLLLDRCGIDHPVLVGQSWGGNVVLDAGARWPERMAGIAAVDGGTIDLQQRFVEWEECARVLAPPVFDGVRLPDVEHRMRRRHPDWTDEAVTGTLANFAELPDGTLRPRLSRERHMQILRALWQHRPSERYRDVAAPVLLIPADTGDADATAEKRAGVEAAAAGLASLRVEWLRGDHDLHAQQPDAVAGILLDAVQEGFFG